MAKYTNVRSFWGQYKTFLQARPVSASEILGAHSRIPLIFTERPE